MTDARRPLASRSTGWARAISSALARSSITPNQISVASIAFALIGSYTIVQWPTWPAGMIVGAACVQLRLLCNLLDGMVAVEGGKASPVGALYNEIPDRIADSLFLVALGYAAQQVELGWFVALAAAVTAYIRVLGGSLGLPQDFRGPQAKPHRMFVMTLALIGAAIELAFFDRTTMILRAAEFGASTAPIALQLGLAIIAIGTVMTCVNRARAIANALHGRG
jgi:phosphatidylglycerophosphate synthase